MKKETVIISGLIVILFLIGLVSAEFTVGNVSHSIVKEYVSGENITGWINISLNNEPSNSVLESSLGGSISLIDLIKKSSNTGFVYTCSPLSCSSNYVASNGENSKTFGLIEEDSVLFGFNITSTGTNFISDISSFSLDLISDNPETENFPLAIDILNDGQNEWEAYKSSGNFGGENFGCYIGTSGNGSEAKIIQTAYCEKIEFSQTPEVEIGAYVNHVEGTATVPFTMSIKRTDSAESANCQATATGSIPNERIACIPSKFHINEEGDYFVCIKTTNAVDINKYEIAYEQEDPCGFTGSYSEIYNFDFEIFARQAEYAPAINFTLNNDELEDSGNSMDIELYIENYISNMYENNCSRGCIIPIKIYSGVEQQVSISNALIQYVAGISTEIRNIYDIQEAPAQISSTFQKLYLDEAGFKTPTEYDSYDFSVKLEGEELFSDKVNVVAEKILDIKSLNPLVTGVKYPTKFAVEVSSANITEYIWSFGDGSASQSTTTEEVTHTYNNVGNYLLGVTIRNDKGTNSSREFNITIAPASQIVPSLLINAETDIINIKSQMETFSQFEQKSINDALKIDEIESKIVKLKDDASKATSEEEFETVLGGLLEIKIPKSAAKIVYSEGITFYPESDNFNLEILKKIGGGDYETGKDNGYKESILAWNVENADTMLTYSEIFIIYENYEDVSLKVFDFSITNKGSDATYFIIKEMENLLFEKDYSEIGEEGYVYVKLGPEMNIVFSTTEDVDFVSLPAFISPGINNLALIKWSPFEEDGKLKKWIFFTIIVTLILFGALIAFGILQIWYKRKYENYLFKDRNNLYNLVNFIGIEKKKGTDEKEIREKLKKAGWNSEQLRYALRKYEGKTTGLPEIISIGEILRGPEKRKEKDNLPDKT